MKFENTVSVHIDDDDMKPWMNNTSPFGGGIQRNKAKWLELSEEEQQILPNNLPGGS